MVQYKMFRLIKKVLILILISTVNSLKCISLKNQECKARKVVIKMNTRLILTILKQIDVMAIVII